MFTPCCPSAGPTGGAGVACPPVHWSFTFAVTTLAIVRSLFACRVWETHRSFAGDAHECVFDSTQHAPDLDLIDQIRSTCQYSRSTGVGRLKMISMTLTRPRASI